jgi:heme oxygenase
MAAWPRYSISAGYCVSSVGAQSHWNIETVCISAESECSWLSEITLSALLRERTRHAHREVEKSFSLETRLATCDAYTNLLLALRDFYREIENRLRAVAGWEHLSPAIEVESRCRTALLDNDLRNMGLRVGAESTKALPSVPHLDSMAQALGCLYVLEGSVLGGQIVSHRARVALGNQLPTSFFSSENRKNVMADWRSFQASLNRFGSDHSHAIGDVVTASLETFAGMGLWLERTTND